MNNIETFNEYRNRVNEGVILASLTSAALVLGAVWSLRKIAMEHSLDYDETFDKLYGEDKIGKWLLSKMTNKRVARIMFKLKKDPEYREMFGNRNFWKTPNLYLDDMERFKSVMERCLDKEDIEYMNAICGDEEGKYVERTLDDQGNLTVKDEDGKTVIYFDIDESYGQKKSKLLLEIKSDRDIVKDLARRLSFDKDVIKYLNTSRAKRTMGWRELLATKLHGKNLDYINYITKTMVADYNPQITGYMKIDTSDEDFDKENEEEAAKDRGFADMSVEDQIADLNVRVETIEDVLGIDPDEPETAEKAKEELGLNVKNGDKPKDEE